MTPAIIRPGIAADAPALTELYNHYIRTSPATFDLAEWTLQRRREWVDAHPPVGRHRLLVAERQGAVIGFVSSGPFNAKQAYETSVETSVYLVPGAGRQGVGTALYEALLAALAGEDVHRAYAGVTLPNPASIALHRRMGFREAGLYRQVGRKFGQWWDVQWLERPMP